MTEENNFKCGFVNIVGLPNAGKSTLLNALSGDKLAITSPKPQTTRQRILSIVNEPNLQIIFSDSPGWIENTAYELHQVMNKQIAHSGEDADVFILVVDCLSRDNMSVDLSEILKTASKPILLCLNKCENIAISRLEEIQNEIKKLVPFDQCVYVSALLKVGLEPVLQFIREKLPVHPAYYPDDIMSDKPIRFFIAELIREKIFSSYEEEIPYSCFVVVQSCKGVDDQKEMAVIDAVIYVNRQSHVSILIGKNGSKIKSLGIEARQSIENYLKQKVYLGLSVKLKKDWRDNVSFLTKSGIVQ